MKIEVELRLTLEKILDAFPKDKVIRVVLEWPSDRKDGVFDMVIVEGRPCIVKKSIKNECLKFGVEGIPKTDGVYEVWVKESSPVEWKFLMQDED